MFSTRNSLKWASILLIFLMTSCSYKHWVVPDQVNLREDETVYKLLTVDGDTVPFAGYQFFEGEPNHLTGVSSDRLIGDGGLYREGMVSGVDTQGEELSYHLEDISALEIPDRTAMLGTLSIILVSIPATILILGKVFEDRYP